jgi:phosphohistidine phosphatase
VTLGTDAARLLVVMRHSKAEQDGPTDFERPLAERGRADALEAGRWLAGEGFEPDHALVSAALRTRQTWEALASGGHWDLSPELDRGLYSAEPDTAVDLITLVDDAVRRLVVVGHNPTMASVAQQLGDGDGDPGLEGQLLAGFPTSAMAVFSYDGAWADLGERSARLVGYHVGRG